MSDLRQLLHSAGPEPLNEFDPDDLRVRVARRRRTRRLVTSVTVVVVAALGLGVGVVLDRRSHDTGLDVINQPTPTLDGQGTLPGRVRDVSVGGGGLWVVGELDAPSWYAAQLDPSSGSVLRTVPLARVVRRVVVGRDVVWVFGGGDGGEPDGGVVAIDAQTGDIIRSYGYAEGFSPYDLAVMDDDSVWVSDASGDRVLHLVTDVDGADAEVPVAGQPTDIVIARDGRIWVKQSLLGTVSGVDPVANEVVATNAWTGGLLAASVDGAVWTTDGDRLVQLAPDLLATGASAALGVRIEIKATAVAVDDSGLWVGGPEGVARFTTADLAGDPHPSATLAGDDVVGLAGDSSGVWFTTPDGEIHRWTPGQS